MMSRAERTPLTDWWWTVDRGLLAGLTALMVAGLVFLMGGGPPVAEKIGLPTFHFLNRQAMYLAPTILIIVAVSFLSLRHIRRVALATWIVGVTLCILAGKFGPEIKGAHRWIQFGPFGLQPSEFVKPAFVVVAAWAFSEGAQRRDMPGGLLAILLLPVTIVPLILQPDFGQTMLITIVWCSLFFVAGLHWFWVAGLGVAGLVGVGFAYQFLHHVRERITPASSTRIPVTASRNTGRGNRSIPAAGSAPARGRAWPSATCPTPIPTSSSPSPARSSASSSASASSASSPISSCGG